LSQWADVRWRVSGHQPRLERCIDRGFWQAKFGGEKIFGGKKKKKKKKKKKLRISATIPETAVNKYVPLLMYLEAHDRANDLCTSTV
jgi:hypothetical protein